MGSSAHFGCFWNGTKDVSGDGDFEPKEGGVQDYVGCYDTEVSSAGWFEVFGISNMFCLFEISVWCGRDVELFLSVSNYLRM